MRILIVEDETRLADSVARGLRLQPDTSPQNAPSVLGGSPVNLIAPGIVGATIAGGGSADYEGNGPAPNTVSLSYGTVGGGVGNDTLGVGATIGGGYNNTGAGFFAVVGGGGVNVAHGDYTTVGGGLFNQATNTASTVAGGRNNSALGRYSSVGGGTNVQALGEFSTVAGGRDNIATVSYGTISGGRRNSISAATDATVGGGNDNDITQSLSSTISGGSSNTIALNATNAVRVGEGPDPCSRSKTADRSIGIADQGERRPVERMRERPIALEFDRLDLRRHLLVTHAAAQHAA